MTEQSDRDVRLQAAADNARALSAMLRRQSRRPFVIEITGTPKAGKTTLIGMLDSFLRACDWRVHVLKERAGECPLPMKGHFFFNTWTMGTMLAGLLDAVDRERELVILDRGIFDALIWLEMQSSRRQVAPNEMHAFKEFVTLERWRTLVDVVCVVQVRPEVAMERENHGRLLPRSGSVMNPRMLGQFNAAASQLITDHNSQFSFVSIQNEGDARDGAIGLIETVLDRARSWCDPRIAVMTRERALQLIPRGHEKWNPALWNKMVGMIEYRARSEVEDKPEWVQVLACGAPTHDELVFRVIRRTPRHEIPGRRHNTAMLWQGCHVEEPSSGQVTVDDLKGQLGGRLLGDLHLAELGIEPQPKGVVWKPDGEEPGHLGIIFRVPVLDSLAEALDDQHFKTNGRGYWRQGKFVSRAQLAADKSTQRDYTVEEWSEIILTEGWVP